MKKLQLEKPFIEHNLKAKYSVSIEILKDKKSPAYKMLTKLEKKWIAILNYLDSAENQIESNKSPKRYTTNEVINSISPFNSFLAEAKYIMYNFNKKNTYNFLKNKCNTYVLLNAAFYAMDSLISIPFFAFKPKFLNIELFFFWKPSLKNKNLFYSNSYSKFALIYEKNLQNLGIIISKLLRS